ncbi:hypothetical protein PAECIP111893_00268 [Paenibacillus plantiphilus]|uniref:Phage neck terminator protein gp12-like domain-containing protein n=1 Tax=Paenibacillus plantiphilus TaxID=2905650 RepID=A0ABM9BLX0_9BACL|nr:hypothetical protein [Paenibacillus plantiphilus]CAH1190309.1 hypothetical protein PAECIP111893_00268 [Paenibacillus plantiphilus]
MIPYVDIRLALVTGLAEQLGVIIVPMNDIGEVPEYPFVTYDFLEPSGERIGFPTVFVEGNELKHVETVIFSVSLQTYAADRAGSVELALRIRDWLMTEGHWQLKDAVGVVVTNIGSIDNRDIQLGDEWERRHGFEVDFRTTNIIIRPIESLEIVNLKGVESIG